MAFSGAPETAALASPQARYAAHAAARRGYAFQSLDGRDGYLFEVRDGARAALFMAGAGTPYALNDTRAASIARDKAFCAQALRRAGISVLPGEMFFVTSRWRDMRGAGREAADARAYVSRATMPIFCKPISASNGLFAETIDSVAAFEDYMKRVEREHFAILVQPYVRAPEYRVFVLNDVALFSYRKHPPQLIGDGERAVGALLATLPVDERALPPARHARLTNGVRVGRDHILRAGEPAWVEGPANRAAGGEAGGLVDGADPDLARIALAATAAIGLRLAAVDIFELPDGPSVIEVNSNPMIATLEDQGRWDLIETIWSANIEAALR